MDILEKLFDSPHRAKVIKQFIFNPENAFTAKSIASKVKAREKDVRREISILERTNFVKRKNCRNEAGRRVSGWQANPQFKYTDALQEFLLKVSPVNNEALVRKLGGAGRIKLVVMAGVFIQDAESRVDLLVVGDRLKKNIFDKIIREIESEIGREVRYALLESVDFEYRLGIGDRLLRDIFDYRHEVICNKIGLVE